MVMRAMVTWQKPTKKRESARRKKLEVTVNSKRANAFKVKELAKM